MDAEHRTESPDFKGLRHSKIGYFKEVRKKIKELETLNIQLARRHSRLDAIFNSMSDGVAILDRDLSIVFTNRVQKDRFPGIGDGSQRCHQLFYQRDKQCPDCPVRKTFQSGDTLRGEYVFKKGRLTGRFFEWTTSPIIDPAGHVDEVILIMRDITERKEYEFRLMQTDRMVSVGFLATSLAHEINNPLTSIAGFSEGLLKRLKTEEAFLSVKARTSFREYLEIINNEAYRCKDIIQNLRDFSSGTSDDYEPVDIDIIIEDTISLIQQHAKDHQIKIRFHNQLAAGFNQLTGKSSQLKHLFLNLFKRLFVVLTAGGEIVVFARNDGEQIEIALSDPDGSLSDELSGGVAIKSQQGCLTRERDQVDLSICYHIIRHHQGEIRFLAGHANDRRILLRFPSVLA